MAKKKPKSLPAPPRDVDADVSLPSPVDLAQPVSDRVQIEGLIVSECTYRRSPGADSSKTEFAVALDRQIESVARRRDNTGFSITIKFKLSGFAAPDAKDEEAVSITCSFVLVYSCNGLEAIGDENLAAFARTNAVFNAWPYWRQFVQDASVRMALSPIILPVFRVP